MTRIFRSLMVSAFIFVSAMSSAQNPSCQALFRPAIDQLLERAGNLELQLNQVIARSRNPYEIQNETRRLVILQEFIDRALSSGSAEGIVLQLLEQLDEIANDSMSLSEQSAMATNRSIKIESTRAADKDYEKLQPNLKDKLWRFLEEASRSRTISEISPTWALERLAITNFIKEHTYSVRLNAGYRVIFTYQPTAGIKILRLSNKVTHE